jgi:hypothetical protein
LAHSVLSASESRGASTASEKPLHLQAILTLNQKNNSNSKGKKFASKTIANKLIKLKSF